MRKIFDISLICGFIFLFFTITSCAKGNIVNSLQVKRNAETLESIPSVSKNLCTLQTELSDVIGPATVDLIRRSIEKTRENLCHSIFVLINTPGGDLKSTRLIVEEILNSPFPFLCLVFPSGGHAGSAGAIILQACHVSGAMDATNIGAATPIFGTGENIPEDLRRKLLNDTRSWVEGLAHLRQRNEKFAQEIIMEAKSVSAREALKIGAIDYVANTKEDFLKFTNGRLTQMSGNKKQDVKVGELKIWALDWRYKIVSFFSDPQIAYVIFMMSIGLLYYEFTHPGFIAPGVIGAVGLIMGLVSLHKLDVTWGALLLVLLGFVLMVLESFVAGFGILGLGGIGSFILGSLMLFDPESTGVQLPLPLILSTSMILGLATMFVAYLAFQSRQVKKRGSYEELMEKEGTVVTLKEQNSQDGQIEVGGELWNFHCSESVSVGDIVLIKSHQGFTLFVEKKKEN